GAGSGEGQWREAGRERKGRRLRRRRGVVPGGSRSPRRCSTGLRRACPPRVPACGGVEKDATLQGLSTGLLQRGVLASCVAYCPTVKSIRFSTVPAASRTSTCQAPVQSAGTVLRLHVRQGDPPTCSSTSPTCVSPWNHTWWMLEPPAPSSLVQQLS